MNQPKQRTLFLDLPYTAWRDERRKCIFLEARELAACPPVVRQFTFRDLPDGVEEAEGRVVLVPQRGVTS